MKSYISFSAWQRYMKCEACALAIDENKFKPEPSIAMLVSLYVDKLLLSPKEEIEQFIELNGNKILKRDKTKRAEFIKADNAIKQAMNDPIFVQHLQGQKQVKLTGKINGIEILGYADIINDKALTDLKTLANLDRIWNDEVRKKHSVISERRYDVQLAVYQELWLQMTGELLPVEILALTKEDISQRKIITFRQEDLEEAMIEFTNSLQRIIDIRTGNLEPNYCGSCDHCKLTQPTETIDFRLVGLSQSQKQRFICEEFERRN